MSERATIKDIKANEELDKELEKKCTEIFILLDEHKINFADDTRKYFPGLNARSYCYMRVFNYYGVVLHIDVDKALYITYQAHDYGKCSIFVIGEFLERCEVIRKFIEYCDIYFINYHINQHMIYITKSEGPTCFIIKYGANYDTFNFEIFSCFPSKIVGMGMGLNILKNLTKWNKCLIILLLIIKN